MNQAKEGNNADAPLNIPVKRKRGRPRKDKSLNRGESANVPPRFQGLNENKPRQVTSTDDANDGTVGQTVKGVIEGVFDAGYLLTVRIGNSSTYLRGIVFRPGHYTPISAGNDVAPHVQMIRRNEIHLPTEKQTHTYGRNPRSRVRKKQRIGNGTALLLNGAPNKNQLHELAPQTAKLMASRPKHAPLVADADVPPVGLRSTVVPVELHPVDLLNGSSPANDVPPVVSQATHMTEGKQMQKVAGQGLCTQTQTNRQVRPESVQNGNGASHQGASEVLHGEEAKLVRLTGLSTADKIHGRVEVSSQSSELHIENSMAAGKSSGKDSGLFPEGGTGNMNEPLLVEPLQTIHFVVRSPPAPAPAPKPLENRTGRMTALLQESITTGNPVSQVEDQATVSSLEPQEPMSPETDFGDEVAAQSKKHYQESSV
ncbi:protein METABOLIC NETWORK MODULATOR 1 isoform X2 [Cornus florida]|uniref:protein METABOLIC NETWORK MODULATOR 1 isoform X2 n=1 Tax=Cornus florida TaxID=4283 RepID=UPI00289E4C6D|nr:protein METABOLIC NETWORK MODULATOR 1 isoform X2 [Cornus florida]